MLRQFQRADLEFEDQTEKPVSAKQYEFHSTTEGFALTENFVFANKDAQFVESMERQEKINQKRLHEIDSEFAKRFALLEQARDDLAADEQRLFEVSHIKAAQISEAFATDEQAAFDKIEGVVHGQKVRTDHYTKTLSTLRDATLKLKQVIDEEKASKDDQEKEALELAASISSLRIKAASVHRMNDLGDEAFKLTSEKLDQVKQLALKRDDKLGTLRSQREEVLSKLEELNSQRIAVLGKVNEIRSGIRQRRDEHNQALESIQEQINSTLQECNSMLRAEKKSFDQLRDLEQRTLTEEIDRNCAIIAELQLAENQIIPDKQAKSADLAQIEESNSTNDEELREAEMRLESVQSELARAEADAERLETAQTAELEAARKVIEDLEKKLAREQKAEVKASRAAVKKVRTRYTKIQQTAAKIAQYAPGEEEQTLMDETVQECRAEDERLREDEKQQEEDRVREEETRARDEKARVRQEASEKRAAEKKEKAKKAAEDKKRKKEAEEERVRLEQEEKAQAEAAEKAQAEAQVAAAAEEAARAKATEEEQRLAQELEKIQKEKAEIEAARAELEEAKAAKARAHAELDEKKAERAPTRDREDDEGEDEYHSFEPPRKVANVTKFRTSRKPAATSQKPAEVKSSSLKGSKTSHAIKSAPVKQAAPMPSARKYAPESAVSMKQSAPVPRSSSNKGATKSVKQAETRKAKTQPAPEYDAHMLASDRINKRKLETQSSNSGKRPKFESSDAAKRLAALFDSMPSSQGSKFKTSTQMKPPPPKAPTKSMLAKVSPISSTPPSKKLDFQSYMNRIKAL